MKKNSNLLIGFILLIIGLLGITFSPSIQSPMTGMISAMTDAQFPPGLAATNFPEYDSKGVQLLSRYCIQCHAIPGPGMHTQDDWPQVIGRMTQYMKTMHSLHVKWPTYEEILSIQEYLQKYAQVPMEKSQYPDLTTPEGTAFLQTCSRCHSAPDPKQHTSNEWPVVVKRMLHNMKVMRKKIPDQKQVGMVTEFLQRHAR